ncbi:bifunctional 6-phosphofructo-2-kinase/fructose-2,6-bisphosphate 2-phosphatase [Rhizoclosmatium globosum]|uniref:Bifunctional 6-phosphofructo-2-kinase/fructose-2,6-bisphosphate 2-phosphatase n=1 Tax=Rhizoclosmatium globosum TaxID=329046 RepID=A0A1Y2BZZ7_9FUNG|nr:bifunctional 6-phosphofructo-2-kinase/fructose-2,6-bisphosphate 2-phosphatase [Rhizoclosmatium globosum]|eukprot:ORY40340.1 bifunctional 6-phosphofructo-2-kinase/fructose-2,6-bisphosphate 2-phosphatase [Rhizoclosmatium globosum]
MENKDRTLSGVGDESYAPPTARLCVAMVGLPARGKTYTARKMARFLSWLGHPSEIFNVGNYRRKVAGASQPHNFFDPTNEESTAIRQKIADLALDDMVAWFHDLEAKEEEEKELFRLDSVSIRDSVTPTPFSNAQTHKDSLVVSPRESLIGTSPSIKKTIPQHMHSTKSAASPSLAPKIAVKKSLVGSARVAIYDATNSTKERRKIIMERCEKENIQVMFVESICDRMDVVLANIKEKKNLGTLFANPSPFLEHQNKQLNLFLLRIHPDSKTYETLSRSEYNSKISFVKLINIGERVLVNNVRGYIQSRIVYFLMNLNITPRCVYFSRHGESMYNVEGKIGGDSDLSPRGWQYAQKLPELIAKQMDDVAGMAKEAEENAVEMTVAWKKWMDGEGGRDVVVGPGGRDVRRISEEEGGAAIYPALEVQSEVKRGEVVVPVKPTLTVWTSTLRRTVQTASGLNYPQLQWKALDELDSGVCDGLTYEQIEEQYPDDFAARDDDKYNYRYKGGESYADLVRRLEPVTLELERHHEKNHPILIIGHQAVLRALYAYFMNYSHEELPYVKIPLHTLIKLTFKAYGCIEERFKVDIDAVDTHRPRAHSPLLHHHALLEGKMRLKK